MFPSRNRQERRARRPSRQPLTLEVLEDRTLLSASPTTILDLNGLSVDPSKYSSTDVLVKFQSAPGTPGGPALVAGTTLGSQLPLATGYYQVDLGKGMTVAKALSDYKAEKGVLDAEPDYELSVSSVPNDPLLSQQWALSNINAEQAWNVTNGSPHIVVAILDTGVDYDSPDLYDNIWINQADIPAYWYTKSSPTSGYDKIVYKWEIKTATPGVITFRDLNNPVNRGLVWDNNGDGRIDAGDLLRPISQGGWEQPGKANDLIGWNYVSNNNNPMDDNGHGTNVAGILGAVGNNGTGVVGVDWNVQIMPMKFIGANGYGTVSDFIEALNYAVEHGAKITNNSWEGAPYSSALYDAFQNAQAHGVICVAAAGNEGSNDDTTTDYPADLSRSLNNVVTVAATTNTNQLASFSNYGTQSVDLAAPGVNILSTLPNNQYGAMSGTSMATPEVTGAMALVWGLHPNWSYTQVIDQVLNTTQKLPSLEGRVKTGGLLDLATAVGYNPSISSTPSSTPVITSVKAGGPTSNSMDSIVLTFNEAINVNTFTSSSVTLTNPYGYRVPVSVRVVGNSGGRQIELTFTNQTLAGNYHLSINSSVRDTRGGAMDPYQTTLTLRAAPASTSTAAAKTYANTTTAATKTYANTTEESIKPKGMAVSSITVPAGAKVGNIEVRVDIDFPVDGDLYVYLISPTGKTIPLDYAHGGKGAGLAYTVFSEQASTPIADGRAPFSGGYRPDGSLSQLIGSNAGGTWRLAVRNYGSYSGALLNWSLILTPAATTSSAKASSVESPVSPATTSSPSSVASSHSTDAAATSSRATAARDTNASLPLSALTPSGNDAASTPVAVIDKIASSTRTLRQRLTSLLVGKRPGKIGSVLPAASSLG